jgi:excisionase family DNA binding protein
MGNIVEQNLYTVSEAAAILKLHVKTLRKKIRDGELQAARMGKQYRLSRAQLEEFCGHALDTSPSPSISTRRHVFTSTVVTVDAISRQEGSRLTNTLVAALNSGPSGARVDCVYHEEIGQLKIIINGDLDTTGAMLRLLENLLIDQDHR